MTDSKADSALTTTSGLLTYYSHEIVDQTQENLLEDWLEAYPSQWVRLALIEALYRGRYKTISVGELLAAWTRRGQPVYHFNREFEALICHNFPKIWMSIDVALGTQSPSLDAQQLLPLASSPSSLSPALAPPNSPKVDTHNSNIDGREQLSSVSQEEIPNISPAATLPIPDIDDFWEHGVATIPSLLERSSALETESSTPLWIDSDQRDDVDAIWEMKPRPLQITPIHQFTPNSESSGHYQKLAALISDRS